jgi:hypothetical protein
VVDYITLDRCKISGDDKVIDIDDGLVVANGATVRISKYEPDRNGNLVPRYQDQLFEADSKVERNAVAFTGKSRHLVDDVGLTPDEAIITIRVTKWRGCHNCG